MNLLELAAIAPLAAVIVTASFSFVVLGSTRYGDARRAGEGAAAPWLALAVVAGLIVTALIAGGLAIIVA
ncbi:MAG TPA: hypothetical protein VN238_19315 [Solirubrobacteraceae bacterium]|nr:hypothetical protein [Solirubrobacteraceae bacterium]